jgi:hypothetical protein
VGGRAAGKGDAEASASGSEEEDPDAGPRAPAKTAGGKAPIARQGESKEARLLRLKMERARAFEANVASQKHFHEVQKALLKEFPDTKKIKLRLVSPNPRPQSSKTPEERKAIAWVNEQRRRKRHGAEFSPAYDHAGAINANGGTAGTGMGATVHR